MNAKGKMIRWLLWTGSVSGVYAHQVVPPPCVQRFCPKCSMGGETRPTGEATFLYKSVVIPQGTSLFALAERLVQAGILQSKWAFVVRVVFKGAGRKLKAGSYRFRSGATTDEIIHALVRGETIIHKLTVPEGLTVTAIVTLIRQHPCLSGEITKLPREGRLLPGTYHLQGGETRQKILVRMEEAQQKVLNDIAPSFAPGEEALLILASIVEKETCIPAERTRVAGVFLLRLQRGMPLQADPTVIYGLTMGRAPLGRPLTRTDWKDASPYNTYRYKGLPPTPICCPGEATLRATAAATPGTDLFFVANGQGGHRFSRTLAEQNLNIQALRELREKK